MDTLGSLVGQTIGKYRIIEHLGRGGMAEVYKAYQPSLDRYVALKLMHAFLAGDQDFISRFEREAKNVAALRHSNIVQVYDFDVQNGTPYMVMEFIEGGTLKTHLEELVREGKALSISEAVRIMREVGGALAYAHQRNMIHRDVKPANVLLEKGGRVILTDFGIAKILTGPSYTVTGATIGTPAYMSPEQGLGKPGDHRSDLYAMGVMLYQLTTGQLPFEADTPLAVMLKHVSEPLPMPRVVKPELPEGMERIILKAMAKNPDDRFQSADEMLAQLDNLDTASLLPIPPASMAAGSDAHAATLATPQVSATLAAQPAVSPSEATQLHKGTATVVGAEAVAKPATAIDTGQSPAARRPIALFAVVGVLLLALIVGGGAFAATGGFGLFNQPAATEVVPSNTAPPASTDTPPPSATATEPAGTPTPDMVATQFQSIQETQAALSAALATDTPTATPDLTATFAACTWDFAIASQNPQDGQTLTVNARVTKTLTLRNTGVCAFLPGTVLVETNAPANATPEMAAVPEIAPGQTGDVSFNWPGRPSAGALERAFELRQPDESVIGQPFTLTLRYVPAATPVPTATNTPFIPTPVPGPTVSPIQGIFWMSVTSCDYVGGGQIDFECRVILGRNGGGPGPYTITVQDKQFFIDEGHLMRVTILGRRCNQWVHQIQLFDMTAQVSYAQNLSFLPSDYPAAFPGGMCTLP
jgi:predicted Ser/Thr protein kinase